MRDPGRPILHFITVLVLITICDTVSQAEPRQFPKEFDFRYTDYEDLLSNPQVFHIFTHPDISHVVQLKLDDRRNQLIVGSRGVLFRLDLDDLSNLETTEWKARDDKRILCRSKGRPMRDCYNFIKILLVHEDKVFACGTNAFSPSCTWRYADDLSNITKTIDDGVGLSPFSPTHNSTGVLTDQGDYISSTVVDITGRSPVIYRAISTHHPNLRTADNPKWLNEPDFVSSYEIGDYIYFFFREVAVEYINCGKRRYSRVARVCKNDEGGKFVLENSWTTYFKSRMNCSIPGEYPFYFDEIQSTFLLEDKNRNQTLVYAIFSTPEHALPGSAVCIFSLTAFTKSFNGDYKHQVNAKSIWERHKNNGGAKTCPPAIDTNKRSGDDSDLNSAAQQMITIQNYQLMDDAVQPETNTPYILGLNERWTHVVADHVEGVRGKTYKVIFIATKDGRIRKMVHLANQTETCLVEEIKIVPNGEYNPVKDMILSKNHSALYISTQENIIKIPLHRCDRFTNSDMCLNSMDPYCGWDSQFSKCTSRPTQNIESSSVNWWDQAMNSCPIVEHPVDGNWSVWSPWKPCQQAGNDASVGDCLCRLRYCDNPAPLYGGKDCTGASIEVINCTVHGQWSEWTMWTSCSASCGPNGTRTRLRHCSPPKYGGQPCIGKSQDEGFCIGNPSCPEPPIDGKWSPWSPWSDCSAKCNSGIQTRRRACVSPAPSKDGLYCIGNKQEWIMCNTHTCPALHRYTQWTPWVKMNETEAGYMEQSYRFMCRANVKDISMIQTSHIKTHTRFCSNERKCVRPEEARNISRDGHWSGWSTWSSCSYQCGGGTQWRKRSCDNPKPMGLGNTCEGISMEERDCNTHICKGEWGCWSEYSACSVTCGTGYMTRTRRCEVPGYRASFVELCVGLKEETTMCQSDPCNETHGWDDWSSWTQCGMDAIQYRHRSCNVALPLSNQCQGHSVQFQPCIESDYDLKLEPVASSVRHHYQYTLFHLTLVSCAAFFMGVVISVGTYLCYSSCRSLRNTTFELDKKTKQHMRNHGNKRQFGSFASQCSIEFLSVNNKIYDSCTLSSRGTAVVRDGTFKRDKYLNCRDNGTIRTSLSLRTEV